MKSYSLTDNVLTLLINFFGSGHLYYGVQEVPYFNELNLLRNILPFKKTTLPHNDLRFKVGCKMKGDPALACDGYVAERKHRC